MDDNKLPIQIEVSVDRGSVDRSLADIERKASEQGRKIGQSLSGGFKGLDKIIGEAVNFDKLKNGNDELKRSINDLMAVGKQRSQAAADQSKQIANAEKQAAAEAKRAWIETYNSARAENKRFDQERATSAQAWGKQLNQSLSSSLSGKSAKDSASVFMEYIGASEAKARVAGAVWGQQFTQSLTSNLSGKSAKDSASVFMESIGASESKAKLAGAVWGQQFSQSLSQNLSNKSAKDSASVFNTMFAAQSKASTNMGYSSAVGMSSVSEISRVLDLEKQKTAELAKHLSLFGKVNEHLRGAALLTTELTRAFFGLTILITGFAAPAIFGAKFQKDVEDAQHGIAATLTAMSKASGGNLTYSQTSAIAGEQIANLSKNAVKYNVALEDIVKTYQAIIGPGMAAGMSLSEVGRIATIGTVAVKALNLSAQQVVQEVRDLVQGGIQAASSTLATALGLKDKDIAAAKQSAEGLFAFLEKRLSGYTISAIERQNTLSGAWDVLKIKVQRLFADEGGFTAIKEAVNRVSMALGEVNYATGEIKFNPELIRMAQDYWSLLKAIGSATSIVVEWTVKLAPYAIQVGAALGAWLVGAKVLPLLVSGIQALAAGTAAASIAMIKYTESFSLFNASMAASQSLIGKFNAASLATKGGIIGLALFAGYEIADYFGIVDQILDGTEGKLKKFRDSLKKTSTMMLEGQADSLRAQLATAQTEEKNAPTWQKGFKANARQELERQLRTTENELNERLENEKRFSEDERRVQRNQALKMSETDAAQYKDRKTKYEAYTKDIIKVTQLYNTAISDGASQEQKNRAFELYNRGIANAKQNLEKLTAEERAGAKEKSWFEKQIDSLRLATIAAQEELDKLKGTFDGTTLPTAKAEAAIRRYESSPNAKPLSKSEKASVMSEATKQEQVLGQVQELKDWAKIEEFATAAAQSTRDYTNALAEATEQERLKREIVGKSEYDVDILKLEYATQKQINEQLDRRNKILQQNKNLTQAQKDDVEFQTASNIFVIQEETKARKQAIEERRAYEESFAGGAKEAFEEYSKNAITAAGATKQAFLSAFKSMEDALVTFVKTGKLSFGSLVQTVIDGLIRMAVQAAITNVGQMIGIGSKSAGSNIGGFMSTAWTGIKSFFGFANGGIFGDISKFAKGAAFSAALATTPMAFANGGAFSNSILTQTTPFMFAQGGSFKPAIAGEAGPEAVVPLHRGPGGSLGIMNYGGNQGSSILINVEVNVDAAGNATSTTNASGMGQGLGDVIGSKVKQTLLDEMRPGGLLAGK